jgi:hypothetical protein
VTVRLLVSPLSMHSDYKTYFIAHKCKRLDASKSAVRITSGIALSTCPRLSPLSKYFEEE